MADTPSSKYLTHAQLVDLLALRKGERNLDEYAADIGVSPSMLSNILCGYRRADGEKVLKYLGVKKLTMYIYVRDAPNGGKK